MQALCFAGVNPILWRLMNFWLPSTTFAPLQLPCNLLDWFISPTAMPSWWKEQGMPSRQLGCCVCHLRLEHLRGWALFCINNIDTLCFFVFVLLALTVVFAYLHTFVVCTTNVHVVPKRMYADGQLHVRSFAVFLLRFWVGGCCSWHVPAVGRGLDSTARIC